MLVCLEICRCGVNSLCSCLFRWLSLTAASKLQRNVLEIHLPVDVLAVDHYGLGAVGASLLLIGFPLLLTITGLVLLVLP